MASVSRVGVTPSSAKTGRRSRPGTDEPERLGLVEDEAEVVALRLCLGRGDQRVAVRRNGVAGQRLVPEQHQLVAEGRRGAPQLAVGGDDVGGGGHEARLVDDAVERQDQVGRGERADVVGDGPEELRRVAGEARSLEVLAERLDVLVHHVDRDVGMEDLVVVGELLDELEAAVGLPLLGPEGQLDVARRVGGGGRGGASVAGAGVGSEDAVAGVG